MLSERKNVNAKNEEPNKHSVGMKNSLTNA